jgi:hypothetical protein
MAQNAENQSYATDYYSLWNIAHRDTKAARRGKEREPLFQSDGGILPSTPGKKGNSWLNVCQ